MDAHMKAGEHTEIMRRQKRRAQRPTIRKNTDNRQVAQTRRIPDTVNRYEEQTLQMSLLTNRTNNCRQDAQNGQLGLIQQEPTHAFCT
eukprot:5173126-Pyramimonas_sp.AAC.1